ncbi:MAG: hypothetical protein ACK5BN_17435 [Planctomycetota bacterium]
MLRVIAPDQDCNSTLTEATEVRLHQFLEVWPMATGNRDAALLVVLTMLCGGVAPCQIGVGSGEDFHIEQAWSRSQQDQYALVAEFANHGMDVHQALKSGWPKRMLVHWEAQFDGEDSPPFAATRKLLVDTGALCLERTIDFERLRKTGAAGWHVASGGGATNGARHWNDDVRWSDPWSLRVWLWYDGPSVLTRLLPAFQAEPASTLPALAAGILSEVLNTFGRFGQKHHFLSFERADSELRAAIQPYFERLNLHFAQAGAPGDQALREQWMVYFRLAYDGNPAECQDSFRQQALALAAEDLTKLRKVFHTATEPGDTPAARAFAQVHQHFQNCSIVLAAHGGTWRSLKQQLLALRAINTPCVADDLRYWVDLALPHPPHPWHYLASMMVGVVHGFAGREQQKDPELKDLREQFALFCLERLTDRAKGKQRKGDAARVDEDLIEPVAAWRLCLIRAIADLRVNPEGRGHRTLHWSSQNDPDTTVRKAAEQAYQTIRHARGLPERLSPRRAVMSALWWLRQAHLLGLGIQPDRDLAQRTREKDLTRTREAERDAVSPDTQ